MKKKQEKVIMSESALTAAYREYSPEVKFAADWQQKVMTAVRVETMTVVAAPAEIKQLFRLAWFSAGIAATVLLLFSWFTSLENNGLNQDLQQLYSAADDNSLFLGE